ncbi:5-oxoprolinase subunit PxpB [Aquibacillus sp. 3ASR75-11]|uniref:5-oxoprolinase subunit PxpB n=1 Tax=Terrihalobacillus insolitus TaxID=2950438 RepID=A0A9X4AKH9_9BACI|nr:5-oxoprolinase subunit PxpB [Terrihalobacillus insolitus]MDC3411993.1 5-oxoprolinase subunit PxpB [Terrihalobacillus insolitus]MDC3423322.1 5-oxoprolinase subunit PxpB [Terrihalobacillus insolitus]
MEFRLHPLGDNAVIIEVGEEMNIESQKNVEILCSFFDTQPFDWIIEYIPAFTTVAVFYDPVKIQKKHKSDFLKFPYDYACDALNKILVELQLNETTEPRIVEIPVCYGGELGPDIEHVASYNGITTKEVMDIHSKGDYLVHMIGFAPGFPYIGGMSDKIATPRRTSPRLKIPAGTVGIAGKQTGVYPIETPGGWQLIGRTPIKLFLPNEATPSLLKAGDKIKFTPISNERYKELEEEG